MRTRTAEIRRFILESSRERAKNVAATTAEHFGISRQAAARHVQALEKAGMVRSSGPANAKFSELGRLAEQEWKFPIDGLREDRVWRETLMPLIADLPESVQDIWHYGVTEMVNNAIDHSEGASLSVAYVQTPLNREVYILDDGEGIFHRIQRLTHLYDPREAILELAKGKFTTDPSNHSGEGIFFTSRAFDSFTIVSRNLVFTHNVKQNDWLIDQEDEFAGTCVILRLDDDCPRTMASIYADYAEPDEFTFSKTKVPVRLVRHEGEKLVSRSQAKRLVTRFEKFKTVFLDFEGVEEIGQAFADEIFRVFALSHPGVTLIPIRASAEVQQMILRAQAAKQA